MNYKYKDNLHLTWLENKQAINLRINQMASRVKNELFNQAQEEFIAAAGQGQVLKLEWTDREIAERLHTVAVKLLKDSQCEVVS